MFTGQSFKFGSFGDGNGELNYPCYVAVNSQGHIIVSDMHSHRIQVCFSLVGCSVSLACKGIPYLLEKAPRQGYNQNQKTLIRLVKYGK